MILNRLEFLLMNNPLRAAVQRHLEARRFLRMGGPLPGARALEIGCGRGVGAEVILDVFGAATVDAFDLDPRMVALAQRRLNRRGPKVRLWVGDAAAMNVPGAAYDAVFDFGIIHHVPNWRHVLVEAHRVLKPGGFFFAEEPVGGVLNHPLMHRLFAHPAEDRFEAADFRSALRAAGFIALKEEHLWHTMFWFVATKPLIVQPCTASNPAIALRLQSTPPAGWVAELGSSSRPLPAAMKITHKILGILWMVICGYFFAILVQGVYEARPDRFDTLTLNLFFVLLYLAGAITSFYLLIGAKWARFVLSIVALLTVTASVMGLFAFFNSPPFSFVGITFDIFALASASVLLFARKYVVAS